MNTKDLGRDPRCRTNRLGIDLAFEDALGNWHETSPQTEQAISKAMGAGDEVLESAQAAGRGTKRKRTTADLAAASVSVVREFLKSPDTGNSVIVMHADEERSISGRGVLFLESGEARDVSQTLPKKLPHGYHQLRLDDSKGSVPVIVAPRYCFLPPDLRTWGWSVQLYAARSRESWGIGDFHDLHQLAKWSRSQGDAGMMLLNPLCAATPVLPIQSSPYFPTTRLFLSPLSIHIPSVPGATEIWASLEAIEAQARTLNSQRLINRDLVFELKMRALELLWRRFSADAMFDAYCTERGTALDRFATFCAIAEVHQSGWHTWPQELRHPNSPAVHVFAETHKDRIRFHQWVQWLLDIQLAKSAGLLDLMQDLPIGVDPDGADAWAWQDVLAQGVGVGAPPDEFNTQGQDWGLPPFVPHKLRASGYQPFVETIRAAFRHCHALRIDHVMGLFRLFWIPWGMKASEGAYVRYNEHEMLSIVALESERAKAYVVGEDLGTVEDGARETLASFNVLSYCLLWFEKDRPATYRRNALAAVTTHDLPTVAGLWNGSDLCRQRELGLKPNDESTAEIYARLSKAVGVDRTSSIEEVITGTYQLLSSAPSSIFTACLDDALAVEERPNIPATNQDQNPNWSLALPAPIEDVMSSPLAARIALVLSTRDQRQQ